MHYDNLKYIHTITNNPSVKSFEGATLGDKLNFDIHIESICLSASRWINPLAAEEAVQNSRPLHWRHNGRDSVSNHQPRDCLLNRLFRHRSMKTSKLRVTGLCVGNSPGTGEFPTQMASNAENVSIWWRHHGKAVRVCWTTNRLYYQLLAIHLASFVEKEIVWSLKSWNKEHCGLSLQIYSQVMKSSRAW